MAANQQALWWNSAGHDLLDAFGDSLSKVGWSRNRDAIRGFLDPTERPVKLVIDHRMTDVGEVNSNLVMPAGDWFRFDERVLGKTLDDSKSRGTSCELVVA
ncbi:MAG: hypothetical protein FD138_2480 [Planctomycetota bacterium]|nr:MAG: hypothetical protein FD138_2480 [Planctomycetota bacterium]